MARVSEYDLASSLRHRVSLMTRASGQDAAGQPSTSWTQAAEVWADVRVLNGLEMVRAGEMSSVVKSSIRIRWREDVTTGMRVHHGSTVYEIRAVLPDYVRRDRVDLACEAVNVET